MLGEHRLDFGGVDILAPGDDQVIAPVEYPQAPRGVQGPEIPAVQPAPAQGTGRGLGLAEIAPHEGAAANADLAGLARGQALAGRTRDLQFGPRQRAQAFAEGGRRIHGKSCSDLGGRLGEPVGGRQGIAEGVGSLEQRRRCGATPEQEPAKAFGRRALAPHLEQARKHGGHQGNTRHPPALERPGHLLGVEARMDFHRRARQAGAQEDREPPDVEERHAGEPAIVRAGPEQRRRRPGARPESGGGEDRALGPSRGPRRVDQGQRAFRFFARVRPLEMGGARQGLDPVLLHARTGKMSGAPGHLGGPLPRGAPGVHEKTGAGVGHDIGRLFGQESQVEWEQHRADFAQRPEQARKFLAVGHHRRHHVAGADAEPDQAHRQCSGFALEFAVTNQRSPEAQGHPLGIAGGALGQPRGGYRLPGHAMNSVASPREARATPPASGSSPQPGASARCGRPPSMRGGGARSNAKKPEVARP